MPTEALEDSAVLRLCVEIVALDRYMVPAGKDETDDEVAALADVDEMDEATVIPAELLAEEVIKEEPPDEELLVEEALAGSEFTVEVPLDGAPLI